MKATHKMIVAAERAGYRIINIEFEDHSSMLCAESDWFPVERMLPDCGKDVLLRYPNGTLDIGRRVETDSEMRPIAWETNALGILRKGNGVLMPSHWQALPFVPNIIGKGGDLC